MTAQLFHSFFFRKSLFNIQIYLSYDIINSPPLNFYNFIINPANEALVGTRQSYFPVGGPVSPLQKERFTYSTSWGGMEIGENMLYGVQVFLAHLYSFYNNTRKFIY
jgi:hypothetical protein